MANILIIDDQAWITDLCRKGLADTGHTVSATDNIESVTESILSFKPKVVLLNQYLKHGFFAGDVLNEIKKQNPDLPVIIVSVHDTHLYGPQLSQADGHLVKSHTAADELKQKISDLLTLPTGI